MVIKSFAFLSFPPDFLEYQPLPLYQLVIQNLLIVMLMNSFNTTTLSSRDLQQVSGGAALIVSTPGCILYVPGFPGGGATTDPVSPVEIPTLFG